MTAWYRNRTTGDRGKLEVRDGEKVIVYDRPMVDQWVPYSDAEWKKEDAPRGYSMMELGQIAWAADRELCRILGDYERAEKKWGHLTEVARQKWIVKGPVKPEARVELFDAIMAVLRPMGTS